VSKLRFMLADCLIGLAVWIWPPVVNDMAKAALDGLDLASKALSEAQS